MNKKGSIIAIDGPLVKADNMYTAKMHEMVEVGNEGLIGEIIQLEAGIAFIQVYEDTNGLKLDEPVTPVGMPLYVELGPGLVGNIFDGIQRPLVKLWNKFGDFIKRGVKIKPLDRKKRWDFRPLLKPDTKVQAGDFLGEVQETQRVVHKIMVPPHISSGTLQYIASEGEFQIEDEIAQITNSSSSFSLKMLQTWPVRTPRPYSERVLPDQPLITGQRVIDLFFPIAKGGVAAIPGGFGCGKTMSLQQIAKWATADIIIYIGCGERGNEMTDVLTSFPELIDPRTNRPLLERTVIIANTSNMPVSAREASIYTGITIGEYYREMGYDVAIMADSTSRWAEALREISARLEEIPAEEGYPSYLPTRLAEFYERAGKVLIRGNPERFGTLSLMGAVSPPAGDFSEPVTQYTIRNIRTLWELDKNLADARHYPAINWINSFSGYIDYIQKWWEEKVGPQWAIYRKLAIELLLKDNQLEQIVKLIGSEALPDDERLILFSARLIKEGILQQNAMDKIDTYCSPEKQFKLLEIIIDFHKKGLEILKKLIPAYKITELPIVSQLIKLKTSVKNTEVEKISETRKILLAHLDELLEGAV
ncbi:MAG: V-type ATP synthase subunit A [Candidatus Helarchaeota archaeon]